MEKRIWNGRERLYCGGVTDSKFEIFGTIAMVFRSSAITSGFSWVVKNDK